MNPCFWLVVANTCGISIVKNITTFFKTEFIGGTPFVGALFFWDTQY